MGKTLKYHSKEVLCPVCGSNKIGLWNARKMTYHCHDCDSYFSKYGSVYNDSEPVNSQNHSSGWNGFTDPDDFPSDGFGGSGW